MGDAVKSLIDNLELITDCCRYSEGILTEKQVRQKYHLVDEATWERLGSRSREVRIYSPNSIRDRESTINSIEVLVRHGWLVPSKPSRHDRRVWQVVRKGAIVHPTVAA